MRFYAVVVFYGFLLVAAMALTLVAGCAQQPAKITVDKSVHLHIPIERLDASNFSRIEIRTDTDTTNTSDTQTDAGLENAPNTEVSPEVELPLP